MTRTRTTNLVMAFVVLVTLAVFALMALTPTDASPSGPMSGHDMSGHDMSGMTGMSGMGSDATGH